MTKSNVETMFHQMIDNNLTIKIKSFYKTKHFTIEIKKYIYKCFKQQFIDMFVKNVRTFLFEI